MSAMHVGPAGLARSTFWHVLLKVLTINGNKWRSASTEVMSIIRHDAPISVWILGAPNAADAVVLFLLLLKITCIITHACSCRATSLWQPKTSTE
jgi:hypothetical protein